MTRVPVYVLAGGRSLRFGSDKARAELGGVPLVLRLARLLEPIADGFTVVAERPDKYADLGLSTLGDAVPGLGPLGGLHTALTHARPPGWVLVVSADLLELRLEWLERLTSSAREPRRAVVFRDRFWQTFPGLYHTALLPEISRRIAGGELALYRLLAAEATACLSLPDDWPEVVQANTPEELERYVRDRKAPA